MSTIRTNAILDAAGGNTATINGVTPALASQAEAQAGTDNTKLMTPLRTAEAIDQITVLLGSIATTSGTSRSLAGLNLTPYKFLRLAFNGVSGTAGIELFIDGIKASGGSGSAGALLYGFADIDLATGVMSAAIGTPGNNFSVYAGLTSYTTVTTSIAVSGTVAFDAGSIRVYGMK